MHVSHNSISTTNISRIVEFAFGIVTILSSQPRSQQCSFVCRCRVSNSHFEDDCMENMEYLCLLILNSFSIFITCISQIQEKKPTPPYRFWIVSVEQSKKKKPFPRRRLEQKCNIKYTISKSEEAPTKIKKNPFQTNKCQLSESFSMNWHVIVVRFSWTRKKNRYSTSVLNVCCQVLHQI